MSMISNQYSFRYIRENDAADFRKCFDSVAGEGKFLARSAAPPMERIEAMIGNVISHNYPQYVALFQEEIVGWCDSIRYTTESMEHCAELGMGVHREHRGRGLGSALIASVINHARETGIRRIDLQVREDNERAIALYTKTGFSEYGIKEMGIFQEGRFFNLICMGLLL